SLMILFIPSCAVGISVALNSMRALLMNIRSLYSLALFLKSILTLLESRPWYCTMVTAKAKNTMNIAIPFSLLAGNLLLTLFLFIFADELFRVLQRGG